MKKTFMAKSTASLKATEALLPSKKYLYEDKYSIMFLSPIYKLVVNIMKKESRYNFFMKLREKQTPGVVGSILCRVRYIDDILEKAIAEDFDAVVNLGSGYDTRSLRIKNINKLTVFEVDHPDVIKAKKELMSKPPLFLPLNLTFVPIDFNTQDISDQLRISGYKHSMKTLFIWEGVTQYITKEGFENTIEYISKSVPGSQVVFTYVVQDFFDNPEEYPEGKNILKQMRFLGFDWTNTFYSNELKTNLENLGLSVLEDIGSDDYIERYLKPLKRDINVSKIERIILAEVN